MFWLKENISLRLLYSRLSFGSEEMISQSPVNVIKQWVSILCHYTDVIMSAMVSQITCVSIIWSIICSGADERKHPSSASLAFVREIHWWPMDSPHKGPVTRKMYPFGNVIMVLFQIWWILKYGFSWRIFVNLENAAEMVSPVTFITVVELLLNFYYYGVMCKISKRITNWAIKYGKTRFREIWV